MWLVVLISTLTEPSSPENLLANPGFEEHSGETPILWSAFVMPMRGAYGRVEEHFTTDGRACVVLHNPESYEKEPANNWSQNVIADLGGKRLLGRGVIKIEDATEAAIWIQCCRKSPWAVLASFSSSTATPLSGSRDWTPVEVAADAPSDTDYVVIRCVLKGRGTAWFDDLHLSEDGKPEETELQPLSVDEESSRGEAESVESLLQANRELMDAARALRETNKKLSEQVSDLRRQMSELRQAVSNEEAAVSSPELGPLEPTAKSPPLVPHGVDIEELR